MDELENSILRTISKLMGPGVDDDFFDPDLIIHINSAFSRLCQLGVGKSIGVPYKITGPENTWDEFIDDCYQEEVKQYIWLKCKMVFDPPTSSTVKAAYDERIKELEWTMNSVSEVGY